MSTTTETSRKFGTLAEFVSYRASQLGANREQLEAFGREFYDMLLQIVNTRENGFTLQSIMRFPRLDVEAMDLITFCIWSLLYNEWLMRLFAAELETLRKVRITWE